MITKGINPRKQVLFIAPAQDVDKFDNLAWSMKLTRSELLRQIVQEKIAEAQE